MQFNIKGGIETTGGGDKGKANTKRTRNANKGLRRIQRGHTSRRDVMASLTQNKAKKSSSNKKNRNPTSTNNTRFHHDLLPPEREELNELA